MNAIPLDGKGKDYCAIHAPLHWKRGLEIRFEVVLTIETLHVAIRSIAIQEDPQNPGRENLMVGAVDESSLSLDVRSIRSSFSASDLAISSTQQTCFPWSRHFEDLASA